MGTIAEISMSLDGFVAGPNPSLEHPLGEGGERLHEWVVGLEAFKERHGQEGGEASADSERIRATFDSIGAFVMGRRMYSGGEGPWDADPNADGWWGDDPPFRAPVFVLTHHARERAAKQGGTSFTFVTDGVESAIRQAREAAGDRNVGVAGGADAVQQALRARLVDELRLHLAPVLLGSGTRLFEGLGDLQLERTEVVAAPAVTHLTFRVVD
jgi:dihydrofolate reductase